MTVPIGTGASAVTVGCDVACTGAGRTPVTVAYGMACTACTLVAAAGYVATPPAPDVDAAPLGVAATTGTGVMVGTPVPGVGLLLGWN